MRLIVHVMSIYSEGIVLLRQETGNFKLTDLCITLNFHCVYFFQSFEFGYVSRMYSKQSPYMLCTYIGGTRYEHTLMSTFYTLKQRNTK